MNIYQQLQRDEGLELKVYKCTEGYPTIGYGRNLETNGISQEEAELMLSNDVKEVYYKLRDVDLLPSKEVTDLTPREAVWLNMGFQMGVTGVLKFKRAIKAYQLGDFRTCAEEMLDSKWAVQTPNRAKRLVDQMISGQWQ